MNPLPQWQLNTPKTSFTDPAQCAARAHSFDRRIRLRNMIEYAAGAFVLLLFGGLAIAAFIKGEALIGGSAVLTFAGVCVVLWQLQRRASVCERHPEQPCLDHLQAQYRRQYTALRAVPVWYLGPLVPGVALFYLAIAAGVARKTGWPVALEGLLVPLCINFGLFGAIALANWIAARSLKRELDAMSALA